MSNTSPYYQSPRHEVVALLPKHYSRVLEIGCGAGRFRENLNQEHEYWGIEPVEPAAKIASKKLDKVLIGTYQEVLEQLPKDYFDLVVCNDVIEHMPDHEEFFQSIKNYIQKDGYLIA
jgi:2-polyprenyl-3-methyl-5-hydroxy-6-metoxy-1,4-benzoquinol methylase